MAFLDLPFQKKTSEKISITTLKKNCNASGGFKRGGQQSREFNGAQSLDLGFKPLNILINNILCLYPIGNISFHLETQEV